MGHMINRQSQSCFFVQQKHVPYTLDFKCWKKIITSGSGTANSKVEANVALKKPYLLFCHIRANLDTLELRWCLNYSGA